MHNFIPLEVKKKCCEMQAIGIRHKKIYDDYYTKNVDEPMSFRSFTTAITRWSKKIYADRMTLDSGTYEGFTAHGATVQVSSKGEIVQAWIKQHADSINPDDFVKAIQGKVEPYEYRPEAHPSSRNMLEISLFDMHWGIAFMDYYKPVLEEVLEVIHSHHWKRIVIPYGQDFFHNDSIANGQTTKGTVIEKVDMVKAVKDGQRFMYAIIDSAIKQADEVKVIYTPGNHDRSISWMFMQTLLERYGEEIIDDSLEFRKVITYGKNAIMITHGDAKKATAKNLAHIFPVAFPEEFAGANIREVHAGHLHHESEADVYGVMVRRLSSGNVTDEWADKEDFIGSHKRFMLFEWSLDKLKAIHYI